MNKSALLKARLPAQDIEIPGVGTVKVRGLSRDEVLSLRDKGMTTAAETERQILSLSLVDPALTEDEVGEWQKGSTPGEMEKVTDVVMRLSGLAEDSPKQAMTTFPDESGN